MSPEDARRVVGTIFFDEGREWSDGLALYKLAKLVLAEEAGRSVGVAPFAPPERPKRR